MKNVNLFLNTLIISIEDDKTILESRPINSSNYYGFFNVARIISYFIVISTHTFLYVFFFLNKNINITKCLKAISDLLFIISFIYFSINSAVGFDPLF